jgi:MFS family permease
MIRQRKIFYGWWVAVALFGVGMLSPMARYSMAAFFPFVSSELGWSRTIIGSAQSFTMWVYGAFSILSGWMIDTVGSRKTIFLGGLLCFCGWMLLSTVKSVWQLYLYYGLIMALAVSMSYYVPIQATIRKWFIKQAGLVAGIIAAALSVGTALFTPFLTEMSSFFGWRETSVIFAFALGLPIILLAFFIIRDTPESMGLYPDNEEILPASSEDIEVAEESWTAKEVVKMPQFWLFFIAFSISGIPLQGILSHLVMWGVDLGSTMAVAGIFVTAMSVPSIISKIWGGWLGDKYGKKRIIIISNLFCFLVMLWAWQGIRDARSLIAFAILMGIGYGLPIGLFTPYLGDLFGRAHVGFILGINSAGYGLIGGCGALIWGMIFDMTGNYNPTCLVSAVCYAVAGIAVFLIRPLVKEEYHQPDRW